MGFLDGSKPLNLYCNGFEWGKHARMTMDGYQQQAYPYGSQGMPTSYGFGMPGMSFFGTQNQSYGGGSWSSPLDLTGGSSFLGSSQGSSYAFPGFSDIIQSFGFSQGPSQGYPDFSQGYGFQGYPGSTQGYSQGLPANFNLDDTEGTQTNPGYDQGDDTGATSTSSSSDSSPSPPTTDSPVPPPPKDDSNGAKSDGYIDNDTKQQSEGDCVFLSTTRGISQTDQGRADIKNAIKANDDGSYDVQFKGSDKSYHVSKEDAEKQGQWANGDEDMQILGCAADQYFKDHGQSNGLEGQNFGNVSKLLTGKSDSTTSLTGNNSVDEIKQKLTDAAPNLGKTVSIGLSGGVADGGDWKAKDTAHEFQIENIDTKSGMVTYTNPWDTSQKRTISMDDLAKQLVADPNGSTIDIFNAA
jgi:hypothetical protein